MSSSVNTVFLVSSNYRSP